MGHDFDEQFQAARKRTAERGAGTYAREVQYIPTSRELLVTLGSGERVRIGVELLEPFARGTDPQLSTVEVTPLGDLYCRSLDEGLSTVGLVEGRFGSEAWMKSLALRVAPDRLQPPPREPARSSLLVSPDGKTGSSR